jgi:hypothetical protein
MGKVFVFLVTSGKVTNKLSAVYYKHLEGGAANVRDPVIGIPLPKCSG